MAKVQSRKAIVNKSAREITPRKSAAKKVHKATVVVKRTGKIVFRGNAKQTATLVRVGRSGAANAIRASKALGLPITYIERGKVIQEMPNGVKNVLATVTDSGINRPVISLKKGMTFHAK